MRADATGTALYTVPLPQSLERNHTTTLPVGHLYLQPDELDLQSTSPVPTFPRPKQSASSDRSSMYDAHPPIEFPHPPDGLNSGGLSNGPPGMASGVYGTGHHGNRPPQSRDGWQWTRKGKEAYAVPEFVAELGGSQNRVSSHYTEY